MLRFNENLGENETFSTSSAPSGHLLLKEKALVYATTNSSINRKLWCEIVVAEVVAAVILGDLVFLIHALGFLAELPR